MTQEERKQIESLVAEAFSPENIFTNPEKRLAIAKKIQVYVEKDYIDRDLESLVCDVDNFKVGDTPQWVKRKGAKADYAAKGSTVVATPPENVTVDATPELAVSAPSVLVDQLRSGRYGSIVNFQRDAVDALLGKKNVKIWETTRDAVTAGSTNYASASSTSTSAIKTALDDMIDYTADACPRGAVAILGRTKVINVINDFNTTSQTVFSDVALEEMRKKGIVTVYRGVPVIQLRKWVDVDDNALINTSDILVVGGGAVKLGRTKALEMNEWVDNSIAGGGLWTVKFEEEYGLAVYDANWLARINLT